jgi:uncharacterized small protein (DUF1192 family)
MENLTNNRETYPEGEYKATGLAVRSLDKLLKTEKVNLGETLEHPSPAQNLYSAIFGELPKQDVEEEDLEELQNWVETLKPREADTIKRYFGINQDKENLENIAEDYGVTETAIRDYKRRALRDLRSPSRGNYIRNLFMSRTELRAQIVNLEDEIVRLNAELKQAHAKYGKLADSLPNVEPVGTAAESQNLNLMIEKLGLSARAYNALKRWDINTVRDILTYSKSGLMSIRDLGGKSFQEVEAKLESLGLPLRDDSHDD